MRGGRKAEKGKGEGRREGERGKEGREREGGGERGGKLCISSSVKRSLN